MGMIVKRVDYEVAAVKPRGS